jgi:hypothetical protein
MELSAWARFRQRGFLGRPNWEMLQKRLQFFPVTDVFRHFSAYR